MEPEGDQRSRRRTCSSSAGPARTQRARPRARAARSVSPVALLPALQREPARADQYTLALACSAARCKSPMRASLRAELPGQ
eukprot:5024349-Pleurochrysis_carterae.AAC.2